MRANNQNRPQAQEQGQRQGEDTLHREHLPSSSPSHHTSRTRMLPAVRGGCQAIPGLSEAWSLAGEILRGVYLQGRPARGRCPPWRARGQATAPRAWWLCLLRLGGRPPREPGGTPLDSWEFHGAPPARPQAPLLPLGNRHRRSRLRRPSPVRHSGPPFWPWPEGSPHDPCGPCREDTRVSGKRGPLWSPNVVPT